MCISPDDCRDLFRSFLLSFPLLSVFARDWYSPAEAFLSLVPFLPVLNPLSTFVLPWYPPLKISSPLFPRS